MNTSESSSSSSPKRTSLSAQKHITVPPTVGLPESQQNLILAASAIAILSILLISTNSIEKLIVRFLTQILYTATSLAILGTIAVYFASPIAKQEGTKIAAQVVSAPAFQSGTRKMLTETLEKSLVSSFGDSLVAAANDPEVAKSAGDLFFSEKFAEKMQSAAAKGLGQPEFVENLFVAVSRLASDSKFQKLMGDAIVNTTLDSEVRQHVKDILVSCFEDPKFHKVTAETVKVGFQGAVLDPEMTDLGKALVLDILSDPSFHHALLQGSLDAVKTGIADTLRDEELLNAFKDSLVEALSDANLHKATMKGAWDAILPGAFKKKDDQTQSQYQQGQQDQSLLSQGNSGQSSSSSDQYQGNSNYGQGNKQQGYTSQQSSGGLGQYLPTAFTSNNSSLADAIGQLGQGYGSTQQTQQQTESSQSQNSTQNNKNSNNINLNNLLIQNATANSTNGNSNYSLSSKQFNNSNLNKTNNSKSHNTQSQVNNVNVPSSMTSNNESISDDKSRNNTSTSSSSYVPVADRKNTTSEQATNMGTLILDDSQYNNGADTVTRQSDQSSLNDSRIEQSQSDQNNFFQNIQSNLEGFNPFGATFGGNNDQKQQQNLHHSYAKNTKSYQSEGPELNTKPTVKVKRNDNADSPIDLTDSKGLGPSQIQSQSSHDSYYNDTNQQQDLDQNQNSNQNQNQGQQQFHFFPEFGTEEDEFEEENIQIQDVPKNNSLNSINNMSISMSSNSLSSYNQNLTVSGQSQSQTAIGSGITDILNLTTSSTGSFIRKSLNGGLTPNKNTSTSKNSLSSSEQNLNDHYQCSLSNVQGTPTQSHKSTPKTLSKETFQASAQQAARDLQQSAQQGIQNASALIQSLMQSSSTSNPNLILVEGNSSESSSTTTNCTGNSNGLGTDSSESSVTNGNGINSNFNPNSSTIIGHHINHNVGVKIHNIHDVKGPLSPGINLSPGHGPGLSQGASINSLSRSPIILNSDDKGYDRNTNGSNRTSNNASPTDSNRRRP